MVLEQCVQKGVKAAVIISAGFSEVGELGQKLENELVSIARQGGIENGRRSRSLLPPWRGSMLGRAAAATRSNSKGHDSFAGVALADRLKRQPHGEPRGD